MAWLIGTCLFGRLCGRMGRSYPGSYDYITQLSTLATCLLGIFDSFSGTHFQCCGSGILSSTCQAEWTLHSCCECREFLYLCHSSIPWWPCCWQLMPPGILQERCFTAKTTCGSWNQKKAAASQIRCLNEPRADPRALMASKNLKMITSPRQRVGQLLPVISVDWDGVVNQCISMDGRDLMCSVDVEFFDWTWVSCWMLLDEMTKLTALELRVVGFPIEFVSIISSHFPLIHDSKPKVHQTWFNSWGPRPTQAGLAATCREADDRWSKGGDDFSPTFRWSYRCNPS